MDFLWVSRFWNQACASRWPLRAPRKIDPDQKGRVMDVSLLGEAREIKGVRKALLLLLKRPPPKGSLFCGED